MKKNTLLFIIIIAIFTIGIVPKTFQNDTFFNIAIGEYILNNGIDMQEHFSWIDNLSYTYSHWAFDIIIYLLYKYFSLTGIYAFVIIFSITINVTLFMCLKKLYKYPIISLLVTLISSYIIQTCFTARSQIISFLCFIIEIFCLEQFISTNKKRYPIVLILLSIIIANFHAATWPLILILFMPYMACGFLKVLSAKNIYKFCAKILEKKLKKLDPSSSEAEQCKKDIDDYLRLSNQKSILESSKLEIKESYNLKNLLILFLIISFTGLLTPIHNVPYTYIINSMLGKSNFEANSSIDFIKEMQPVIPVANLGFLCFTILIVIFLSSNLTKLKLEHLFLLIGLYLMALNSNRYVYLLVFLGSYPLCYLLSQYVNEEKIKFLENGIANIIILIFLFTFTCTFSGYKVIKNLSINYIDETFYPIGAVEYIKTNLDYKNMRIYNSYNYGSYLMLNDIPVFIDSRLDVYCSEFNDTNIFRDYIYTTNGKENYKDIFSSYDFTHILLYKDEITSKYIKYDNDYNLLYEDEYFLLYEKV